MNSLQVEFFRSPFVEKGAGIQTEQSPRRALAYVTDLKRLVPRLQRLRTSIVITELHDTDQGIDLRFFLQAINQRDLFMLPRVANAGSGDDPYEAEVREVQEEVARLTPLLEQAMSPGITAVRLRGDDGLAKQIRAARELLLKRRGMHVLSGIRRPRNYSSALFFPQGTIAVISCLISNMSPGYAGLRQVSFVGELPAYLENVRFHNRVQLIRPSSLMSEENAMRFLRSMESQSTVTLSLLILWDGVTGQPRELEFRDFVGETPS
jgi:hypothetical protein